jgi:thioredoxin reductase/ferredoxin
MPQYLWVYAAVLVLVAWWYLRRRARMLRAHAEQAEQALAAGVIEPASLHPVVNPQRCLGSSSCVAACPEQALGIVNGKAALVQASACIGHGACYAACPVDAITLVFGTEQRGIDLPQLTPHFETNVPGIFIAGELGGMGLIRKAAEQGRQAIAAIRKRARGGHDFDVIIVGGGPAGISAGLSAIEAKLRYKLIEQEGSLGGAVYHYPRNKITMTAPVRFALIGKIHFGELPKEKLLKFWHHVVKRTGLQIAFRETMETVERNGDGFIVRTSAGAYRTRSVLLALGRRGSPRKLDVPGEESSKVVYRLLDAAQYDGQAVLIVGGGDSAVEAALALGERPGTTTTLSYRGDAFSRVQPANRQALERARQAGRVQVLLQSTVLAIEPDRVRLRLPDGDKALRNDAVIVCAGGQLPTPLLQKIGIRFETKHGTA